MSEKEWSAETVFDVFGDEISRQILVLASQRPISAVLLSDRLDVSKPTIYRRINTLKRYDLLKERIHLDREDGFHRKQFETTLKRATFEIADGGLSVDLALRQDLVDQFEAFWDGLEEGSNQGGAHSTVDLPDRPPTEADGTDG